MSLGFYKLKHDWGLQNGHGLQSGAHGHRGSRSVSLLFYSLLLILHFPPFIMTKYLLSCILNIVLSEKSKKWNEMYGMIAWVFIFNILIDKIYVFFMDTFICMVGG